jgi:hypothetical protein
MEVVKQIFAILGTGIGVLSGLVTLYAKYMDMKKKAGSGATADDPPVATTPESYRRRLELLDGPSTAFEEPERAQPRRFDEAPIVLEVRPSVSAAAIRQVVRAPAIAMMVAGGLGLVFNLLVAGFGYVDEFVTPLTTETQARRAAEAAGGSVSAGDDPQRTSAMLGAVTLFGFAVASAAAVWAGFNMLRLRSYWLSVAGSIAVMPGACVCGFAGVPIGIWSLVVLFRPGVADAFR